MWKSGTIVDLALQDYTSYVISKWTVTVVDQNVSDFNINIIIINNITKNNIPKYYYYSSNLTTSTVM